MTKPKPITFFRALLLLWLPFVATAANKAHPANVPEFMTLPYDANWMDREVSAEKVFNANVDPYAIPGGSLARFRAKIGAVAQEYRVDGSEDFYTTLALPKSVRELIDYYRKYSQLDVRSYGLKIKDMNEVFYDLSDIGIPQCLDYSEKQYEEHRVKMKHYGDQLATKGLKDPKVKKALEIEFRREQNLATYALMRAGYAARKYLFYFKPTEFTTTQAASLGAGIPIGPVLPSADPLLNKRLPEIRERLDYYMHAMKSDGGEFVTGSSMQKIREELASQHTHDLALDAKAKRPADATK